MSESKISMSFPRDYYLECAEEFEGNRIDCVDQELSEFNHDEEDLAYELAYTRYTLAREELELEHLRAQIKQTASHAQKLIEQQNDIISALEDTNAGLVQELDRLRVAGSYMSNVLYNLKQSDDIPEQHRALMGKWQAEWDKAMRYKSEES